MKSLKHGNRKPTQKEIAELSGVSVSTVSMVMRGEGNISEKVKARILDIADSLGYEKKPNSGVGKAPIYITLIEYESFDYQWNFIKPFLLNISKELRKRNIYTIIHHLDTENPNLEELRAGITDSRSRAVCSIHFYDQGFLNQIRSTLDIPVVILNNSVFQETFPAVCVDDFQGMYNGTSYLIQKQHKHFLYFDYFRKDLPAIVADRYLGFHKAIMENRIPFSDEHQRITFQLNGFKPIREAIKEKLQEHPETTAIVFHDDYLASCVLPSIEKLGYNFPDDLSVIAPGDTLDFDQAFSPKLTTIQIDTTLMGKMAADLVIQHLENPAVPRQNTKVIPRIIERGSCGFALPAKQT